MPALLFTPLSSITLHPTTTRPSHPSHRTPTCNTTPPTPDWRAFRAQLVHTHHNPTQPPPTEFAHLLPNPESGALLLANPSLFTTNQQYFHHAVILLFSHTEQGTAGLLLNKSSLGLEMPRSPWAEVHVALGGDVGLGSLFALFPSPDGVFGVLDGVSVGTVEEVVELEKRRVLDKRRVRLFSRYCGWGPGQLEAEVQRGVWSVASVAKELVLADPQDMYDTVMTRLGVQMGGDSA